MPPQSRTASRFVLVALLAIVGARASAQSAPVAPSDLNANFAGDWTGQLEYRDDTSNERVFLPTWLRITETGDHRSLTFGYVYDDGPTKTVREHGTLAPAARAAMLTDHDETSADRATSTTYDVADLEEFAKTERGVLKLTGCRARSHPS